MTEKPTATEIAAERTLLGVGPADYSRLLGIDKSTIWGWEKGRQVPGPKYVSEIQRLRALHDASLAGLLEIAAEGKTVEIEIEANHPRDWYLGLAARVRDRHPQIHIAFIEHN